MKTLSSAQTIFIKILFPTFWISGFGLATIILWLIPIYIKTGAHPPDEMKWDFLLAWIVGAIFIWWTCIDLKRVRIDSENLYISNYLKEVSIPLNMIVDVTENRWVNAHPVTIHFRNVTEFGQKIKFMPTVRFFSWWSTHPVVAELKEIANLVRT
ncbi:MAG: hypothetical protein ACXU7D_10515 [Burkholderiaceae bacterium]